MPQAPSTSATGPPSRAERWSLLGAVLAGTLLRGPRMLESLWYDEIAALRYAQQGARAIVTTYTDPVNHVAHTLLSWISLRTLGPAGLDALDLDVALRLPALLFSLATIVALWGLARSVAGSRVAQYAAWLAAVAPVMVLEGAEARGYSMMIFFAVAATWALRAARRDPTWPRLALYAVLSALGAWSQPLFVYVPAGHAAVVLAVAAREGLWRDAARLLGAIAGAAALTVALYAPMLGQMRDLQRAIARAGGGPPLLGPEGWHMLLQLGGSWYAGAAIAGGALAVIGAATLRRRSPARWAACLLLAGPLLYVGAVALTGTWTYARFALPAAGGALLLAALGLDALARRHGAIAIAATVVVAASYLGDLALRPPKQPLRDAAAYVAQHRTGDEPVLAIGLRHHVMDAYSGHFTIHHSERLGADLAEKLAEVRPTWVIVLYPRSLPAERYDLLEARGYARVQRLPGWVDWGNGDMVVYRRAVE